MCDGYKKDEYKTSTIESAGKKLKRYKKKNVKVLRPEEIYRILKDCKQC